MTPAPASLLWFAQHEFRLAWRDTLAMMTGGKRVRLVGWLVGGAVVYGVMMLIAWYSLRPWVLGGIVLDKQTLLMVTGMGLLFWTVTLSQALESVTRVYYTRSDLDLILSSPSSSNRLFAVRAMAIVAATAGLGALLISPLIWSLVFQDGARWLSAYLVLIALAALSVAIAMGITRLLFQIAGPRRTRLIAQIVAGVIGAGFVIGIQAVAILSHDGFARYAFFQSADVLAMAPDAKSPVWIPARAVMGDPALAALLMLVCFAALAGVIALTAPSYARLATSTAGLTHIRSQRRPSRHSFTAVSQRQALRRKEWKLLQRDPWLLSQSLMQLLYLVPPALLLWVNYGAGDGAFIVIVPVLVMAAGQLAGGLAWLAISGEDAHDLVATAPVAPRAVLHAKVESVLTVIAIVLLPILIAMAFASPGMAMVTAICATLAASASTAIQLWFRVVAKRSMFRRRQVASRAATLCEAFSSIMWAGTGALWAFGTWLAILPAVIAVLVLGLAKLISPKSS